MKDVTMNKEVRKRLEELIKDKELEFILRGKRYEVMNIPLEDKEDEQ